MKKVVSVLFVLVVIGVTAIIAFHQGKIIGMQKNYMDQCQEAYLQGFADCQDEYLQ